MSFKVSNETKVGALAAVSITFLVLGYNFLAGQGSFFSKKYILNAFVPDVSEISTSTPVLYNGYKVGNVSDVELVKASGNQFKVHFVINEDIDIPEGSSVKVSSKLLGGKSLDLIFSQSKTMAENGQTLNTIADTTLVQSMSNVFKPLNAKINSIVNALDSLLSGGELNRSLASLNTSLKSFTRTSDNASALLEKNMPKLNNMMSNVESITLNLRNNNDRINLILANLKSSSDQLAAAKIKSTIDNANTTLEQMGMIMTKINNGEGSIGLLVNDKSLYNQLNNSATDLDKLIKDLNNNPAKYIPIPFTKGQRKKAIEQSEQH